MEQYRSQHGIYEQSLIVDIHHNSPTKWSSSCCPPQWLSDKINRGLVFENVNAHNETCRMDNPELSYVINSGTISIKSPIRWKAANHSYWQTNQ